MARNRSFRATADAVVRSFAGFSLLVLAAATAASCAGPRYAHRERPPSYRLPASVNADAILAPSPDPAAELAAMPTPSTTAMTLRRAFLELELGHTRGAIDATSLVLYRSDRPSANEEAFAHYLRAQAYVLRGTPELAAFDLDKARSLAMDPALRRLLQPARATPARRPAHKADLTIEGRQRWHAGRPNRRNLDAMDRAARITIHHSAVYFRRPSAAAAAAQIQRIQRDHMQRRGYGDIGYHYLVDPAGRIWEGRDLRWQGAHASGSNNIRNVGICVLGNFVRGSTGHRPTSAQVESLQLLVDSLCADHGIARSAIYRHSDFKATQCPGPLLEPVMALLRAERGPPIARR